MIEIHAKLPTRPVFFAGEVIECYVTFRNCAEASASQSSSELEEVIAWSSAQIHCMCTVNDAVVKLPTPVSQEEQATGSQDTSFVPCKGESGHVVLSTKPKILFCDLKLPPGEKKKFCYKETIPITAPPSYRGHNVKYAYKITIGTQKVNSATKLLKIPFRVLVMQGLKDSQIYTENEKPTVSSTNPFHETRKKESIVAVTMQALDVATARRSPNFYNITNQLGKVVRFCLLKSSFRLGEDIIGIFDFRTCPAPCVQFSVTLVSEEEINEECKGAIKPSPHTLSYNKQHEFCLHLAQTHIILPIPLFVTPGFSTDLVTLKWRLHFEFVTTNPLPPRPEPKSPSEDVVWQGPARLDVQTMVWDLPVNICPAHPMHVAQGSPSNMEHTTTI